MAGKIPNHARDTLMTAFRTRICEKMGITPFPHQGAWWAASDGLDLVYGAPAAPGEPSRQVQMPDQTIQTWRVVPRPGGRARVLSDLGAFKTGKSYGAGIWGAGFGAVPGATINLVGLEYDICAPEFDYICEALLSERGMGLKYDSLQNRPRDGKMWLDLPNGARYEARSWERKESLKGKEIDAYIYPVAAGTPVWLGDYSFKPIEQVQVGEQVIGWARKGQRDVLCRTEVKQIHTKIDRVVKLTLEDGTQLRCTPDHRWQVADGRGNFEYRAAQLGDLLCRVVDDPGECPDPLTAAWLGGIYDGEGCRLGIAQSHRKNPDVCKRIEAALARLGLTYGTANAGNDVTYYNIHYRHALKFLSWVPSTRFREKYADQFILKARFRALSRVVKYEEELIEQPVYCLTTSTGNFVAGGTASSNCEAYQLPGIECYTGFSQNLRARQGYALFATTPDRPWVQELHNRAHSGHPDFAQWACVCGVDASVNPFTYDEAARKRDQELMTREKFAIHYGGQLGDFVGRVFNYQRGQVQFGPGSHPELFKPGSAGVSPRDLNIPDGWELVSGADTGTFYTALTVAFSPGGDAFVVAEWPNYRYVAGAAERDEEITIPEWAERVLAEQAGLGGRAAFWADRNSQFKRELGQYGMTLLPASLPVEARTEITREYFQHNRIWLAPWLRVLPFELENAAWPEEASSSGKFARVKDRDHTLDCLEHVLSRRPMGRTRPDPRRDRRWGPQFAKTFGPRKGHVNPHLGKW